MSYGWHYMAASERVNGLNAVYHLFSTTIIARDDNPASQLWLNIGIQIQVTQPPAS